MGSSYRRRRRPHRAQMRSAQMNNRQIKDGYSRQRNDIEFGNAPKRDQLKYPTRKVRMGGNRQRNNRGPNGRQFELKPNRNRASGVRQRIQFNNTNNTNGRQFNGRNPNRVWRQKQRFNHPNRIRTTMSPTTIWPSTSWGYPTTMKPTSMTRPPTTAAAPTSSPSSPPLPPQYPPTETVTYAPPNVISNEVIQYNDNQYRQQIEESERLQREEKLRRDEAERLWRIEQDRLKEMRRHDLDEHRHKEANGKQSTHENQPNQNGRKQPDHRSQEQNEYPNTRGTTQQQPDRTQTEPTQPVPTRRQQQQQRQPEIRNEQTNDNDHAVQTNEVLDGPITTTTLSPLQKKKLKQKLIRERLSKLSPEEQQIFFEKRRAQNRNKKRNH